MNDPAFGLENMPLISISAPSSTFYTT